MLSLLFLLSCSTEVGLIGYTEKKQDTADTNEVVVEASSEPSSEDTALPPREGVTGYVHWTLQQVACPACVGQSNEITISFKSEFHEPITDSHTEWLPQVGECTQNLFVTNPSANPIDVGPFLTLYGNFHSFMVPKVGVGRYETTQIYETQYERDTLYNLSGGDVNVYFNSLHGFDYIEPFNMLYVDPSYAFDAAIYRSGATFFWGPSGTDSQFMITVSVYTPDGSQLMGYVTCVGSDVGQMTIPGQYLSSYPVWSLVAIHLARHKVELVETDLNNSYVESHMEWEVVGTGHIE